MQTLRYLISLALVIIAFGCASTSTIQQLPAVEYGPDEHPAGEFQDWTPKPLP